MTSIQVLSRIAWDWGVRCFGHAHMGDIGVRSIRLGEEAVELCQRAGVPRGQMHRLVDMVYDKPPGELHQELGGIAVTLAVACTLAGTDIESVFLREVNRILAKNPEEFAQRNEVKIKLGMTGDASKAYSGVAT